MPYINTKTVCFLSDDFTDGTPTFAAIGSTYGGNILFANESLTLNLNNSSYGYVAFRVTFTGNLQYLSVAFTHPNGQAISVSNNGGALFSISSIANGIINCVVYENGVSKPNEFLVVVNGFGNNTDLFNVEVSAGATRGNTGCVTLDYNCTEPIYSAETGLHTYSAYDAQYDISRLKTILYSLTPVRDWVAPTGDNCEGTRVFTGVALQSPALPYYYGIGDMVYKVGRDYDRAYGTKKWYKVKKRLFSQPRTYEYIDGPQWWGPYDPNNEPYSPSCIVPKMSCVGRIKKIHFNRDLTKPLQYRYYMGYDIANKVNSNNNVFVYWSWSRRVNYPILGSTHALGLIGQGGLAGMDTIPGYPSGLPLDDGNQLGTLGVTAGALITVGALYAGYVYIAINTISYTMICYGTTLVATVSFPPLAAVIATIGAILILLAIFIPRVKEYRQDCVNLLHHFTDTPYISANTNTQLFRNVGNTVAKPGWHSDGVYFYYQTNGVVTQKEQVITYEYNPQNDTFGWAASIIPDNPTLVTNFTKLLILPYVSGKPLPYCNGRIYYNELLTAPIIPPGKCCELEVCTATTLSIEAGTVYSCISIDDANSQAQEILDSSVLYAQNQYTPIQLLTENQLGILGCNFTHELKVESNPTQVSLYFDGRISLTPSINTKLYYDECGCTEVLNGYYAVTGTTNYRTFYKTVGGSITAIYYMQSSNSTTTTTGQPIIFTNLDYSSNWYLSAITQNTVNLYSNYLITDPINRSFSPNLLLNNYTVNYPVPPGNPYTYQLVKGFIKTPSTHNNFQLYNDFVTTSYSEAPTGWYRPLIDWITEDSFFYNGSDNRGILVNIYERCNFIDDSNQQKGATIVFSNRQGSIVRTDVALTVIFSIYNSSGGLINTYQIPNIPANTTLRYVPFNISTAVTVNSIVINSIQVIGTTNNTYSNGVCRTCTVKICNQTWMTYNISTTKYRNGDDIPEVTDPTQWSNLTTGAFCHYNNNNSYGILYNWYAINDARGLTPTGWHVPSESEFNTLSTCLSGDIVAGGKLKELGVINWQSPNLGATDQFNFRAAPSGYRSGGNGLFYQLGQSTSYFTSNVGGGTSASVRVLTYNATSFPLGVTTKDSGFSVRCIKD